LSRLEGTGLRLVTELRVLRQLGPVRAFFGWAVDQSSQTSGEPGRESGSPAGSEALQAGAPRAD